MELARQDHSFVPLQTDVFLKKNGAMESGIVRMGLMRHAAPSVLVYIDAIHMIPMIGMGLGTPWIIKPQATDLGTTNSKM